MDRKELHDYNQINKEEQHASRLSASNLTMNVSGIIESPDFKLRISISFILFRSKIKRYNFKIRVSSEILIFS